MVDVSNQRRMAAEILKCGYHRVAIDPDRLEDVAKAVTKEDIRLLIEQGAIYKKPIKGTVRKSEKISKKRRTPGNRKGSKYSIVNRKRRWINTIRPLRATLKDLRDKGKISREDYRKYVKMAKSGQIRTITHLYTILEREGIIKK